VDFGRTVKGIRYNKEVVVSKSLKKKKILEFFDLQGRVGMRELKISLDRNKTKNK